MSLFFFHALETEEKLLHLVQGLYSDETHDLFSFRKT